jgi:hypothetical protein
VPLGYRDWGWDRERGGRVPTVGMHTVPTVGMHTDNAEDDLRLVIARKSRDARTLELKIAYRGGKELVEDQCGVEKDFRRITISRTPTHSTD